MSEPTNEMTNDAAENAPNALYLEIQAWAQNAVFNSPAWALNQLNYHDSSIAPLDAVISDLSKTALTMGDDYITLLTQEFGCYLLLTAQKQFGGTFYWSEAYQQPMLVLEKSINEQSATLTLMTWNKVRGRLLGGDGDHLIYFMDEFTRTYNELQAGDQLLFL